MPIASPFHERTQPLCETHKWRDWAGYYSVCTFGLSLEREYNAIRQGAGVMDVTPLFKYDVRGPDAGRFLSRLLTRDVARQRTGRMAYLCWCDDEGKVIDDGTCARLAQDFFRITSAAPTFGWFARHAGPYDVEIRDTTGEIAALALQGPTSRDILRKLCDAPLDAMKYFDIVETSFDGIAGHLSRTGYTGDLGYELWVDTDSAVKLWDASMAAGKDHNIHPFGLDALDITRIEAGFIMQGVDYFSAHEALIDRQKSSPFELGLGWTVKLDLARQPFIGHAALAAEKEKGSPWAFVGLEIDWDATEALFRSYGLPPHVPTTAWRSAVPVFCGRKQTGRATSGTWSPILKKNLALATVEARHAAPGTELRIETTVDWERRTVPCYVREMPFFDPPRKRA